MLMSVWRELITVTRMQTVLTQTGAILVPANLDTLEMELVVLVSSYIRYYK